MERNGGKRTVLGVIYSRRCMVGVEDRGCKRGGREIDESRRECFGERRSKQRRGEEEELIYICCRILPESHSTVWEQDIDGALFLISREYSRLAPPTSQPSQTLLILPGPLGAISKTRNPPD
tara:strand:- start:460 stop:825 length:366 start_codon:yes stop_codon:yes gene_type:complete